MIVKIFINPINYTLDKLYKPASNELLIGVDKGAYNAIKNGIELDIAIGDFDSVTKEEKDLVFEKAKKTIDHPKRKDETDSELAITEALRYNPDKILLYGGIGDRLDHTYANIQLLRRGPVIFITDKAMMYALHPGEHKIKNPYENISFFALNPVRNLSLENFNYNLTNYNLEVEDPLCISNSGEGVVSFNKGLLLVIANND